MGKPDQEVVQDLCTVDWLLPLSFGPHKSNSRGHFLIYLMRGIFLIYLLHIALGEYNRPLYRRCLAFKHQHNSGEDPIVKELLHAVEFSVNKLPYNVTISVQWARISYCTLTEVIYASGGKVHFLKQLFSLIIFGDGGETCQLAIFNTLYLQIRIFEISLMSYIVTGKEKFQFLSTDDQRQTSLFLCLSTQSNLVSNTS